MYSPELRTKDSEERGIWKKRSKPRKSWLWWARVPMCIGHICNFKLAQFQGGSVYSAGKKKKNLHMHIYLSSPAAHSAALRSAPCKCLPVCTISAGSTNALAGGACSLTLSLAKHAGYPSAPSGDRTALGLGLLAKPGLGGGSRTVFRGRSRCPEESLLVCSESQQGSFVAPSRRTKQIFAKFSVNTANIFFPSRSSPALIAS